MEVFALMAAAASAGIAAALALGEAPRLGGAIVLAARVRPKFIGGERAIYDESLKDGYPDFE